MGGGGCSWVEVEITGWRWVHGLVIPVSKFCFHGSWITGACHYTHLLNRSKSFKDATSGGVHPNGFAPESLAFRMSSRPGGK